MTPVIGPAARAADGALRRAIGRWDLTAAIVNGVIGSAIFGLPSTLAALTGALSPVAYLLAGLGILTVVLSFAEVASRFDQAGGPYLYAREAFGGLVGFQAGWLTFWIRVTAMAANLNVLASYLAQTVAWAGAPGGRVTVMAVAVGVIAAVNLVGVRPATWTVDAFTVAKLLPLGLLIVLGLGQLRADVLATQLVARPQWRDAILLLVFAYGGFETPLIAAGEVKRPRRDVAFALLAALGIIAGVYVLVQLVVVGVLPAAARAEAPLAATLEVLLGRPGLVLASLAAVVSVYGWATGSVLQSPRLLYSMAERGELPAAFARVHPRFRTPGLAILVYSGLALVLALWGSFEWNATLSAVVRLITYGLTCLALPMLRYRSERGPGFHLPGGSLIGLIGAAFCLWLLSTRRLQQAWILVALVAAGLLLWVAGPGRRLTSAGRGAQ